MSSKSIWLVGFPNLVLTVVTSASILPLTINIQIENPYLKLLWRNITMVPFLIVMSYIEVKYRNQKLPQKEEQLGFELLMRKLWETRSDLLLCGLCLLAMQVTYLMSGYYTIMTHATLFTNLSPFMLVILRFIMREKLHKYETIGTVIAIIGCIVTVQDQEASKVNTETQNIMLGDALGLLSSVANGCFLAIFARLMNRVPPITAITL
jgi:drug/metabolite transporter (DMT)-like permease